MLVTLEGLPLSVAWTGTPVASAIRAVGPRGRKAAAVGEACGQVDSAVAVSGAVALAAAVSVVDPGRVHPSLMFAEPANYTPGLEERVCRNWF